MTVECWYCRREIAKSEARAHTVEMFRDHKFTYFVVGYRESEKRTSVRIPCCRSCLTGIKRGKRAGSLHAYLLIFSIIIGLVALLVAIVNVVLAFWVRVVIVTIPAALIVLSLRLSRRKIAADVDRALSGERRSTYAYPPFADMIEQGWLPRPGETVL